MDTARDVASAVGLSVSTVQYSERSDRLVRPLQAASPVFVLHVGILATCTSRLRFAISKLQFADCNFLRPHQTTCMRIHHGMRPQDVLVLLKLVAWEAALPKEAKGLDGFGAEVMDAAHFNAALPEWARSGQPWKQLHLARELGLSQTEISDSLNRSRLAGLVDAERRRPMRTALTEFVLHGLRYVFPVEPGRIVRGLPTAHSAPPLSDTIMESEEKFVWPDEEGLVRGQAIEPLYPSVPQAARRDPSLYELLALCDALRVGRAREQQLARKELERRLGG